jgi:acyl-CoA synthetase (NDP forming)
MIGVAGEAQYYEVTKAMLEDPEIDIVAPCLVIPPFLEMRSDEHYRGMIRAWNDTNREKPIIPLIFFGESFEELKKYANKEKAPIFYTPQEAAFAVKLLVERSRILN